MANDERAIDHEISSLILDLHSDDPERRRVAVERLGEIGRPAVRALLHDMIESRMDGWLREGYLYILEREKDFVAIGELHRVHQALLRPDFHLAVPLAAEETLRELAPF